MGSNKLETLTTGKSSQLKQLVFWNETQTVWFTRRVPLIVVFDVEQQVPLIKVALSKQ